MKGLKTLQPSVTTSSPIKETSIIRKISLVGIIGNIFLACFKLFAGIIGNSSAMISDAVHSTSDIVATLIAWIGVKLSKKGADESHPYGHERFECVASIVLGLILLFTGLGIGKVGVDNILFSHYEELKVPSTIALIAAIVSIISKEAMFWYTIYYAKLINSAAFTADAWHHRSDAFSSIGSLIGIAGAMVGFPILDSVASVIICLFIIKVAFDILKDAFTKMLDTSCGVAFNQQLKTFVAKQEGVICVDTLRSRMFGNKIYVDMEIQIDGRKSLFEAHEIAEKVHEAVEHQYHDIKHIMIHMNPATI